MTARRRAASRDRLVLALLALLPLLAHAPAWWEGRLLAPGDGIALHFPLRDAVWQSYRRGELPSWNPAIFTGTPLLAAYRPGAFYPPMAALSPLPSFAALQVLVLGSLAAAGALTFRYLQRLGAGRNGAYVAGLSFALGPYLLGHLGDTATVVAAPLIPLVLLAAETHMSRARPLRAAALAGALALLLLAGSPEAVRAGGLLLAGRLLVGHFVHPARRGPRPAQTVLALAAGILVAAPQLVPTLLLARDAGRQVTGLAGGPDALPGATGLVLRYVSHTPSPALALAALPLALTSVPVRMLAAGLALSIALQWGRGPLAAPGALPLVFDFTLAALAGLSLSAQWRARRDPLGRRLRAWFLFASLASAAALSVAAAALGPLRETLAGAVGVLVLSLILYFSLADSPHALRAGLWLLPLTVSFLLQPHARRIWDTAPTRRDLAEGSPTRQAIDSALGRRKSERMLTLVQQWPRGDELDLAYGSLAGVVGRRSANGYDPMVRLRNRMAFDGMGPGGAVPAALLRTPPARLEALGVRWVQVPTRALAARADAWGLGDAIELPVERHRPRFFPLPIAAATEVRVASFLTDAVKVPNGQPVARVEVRLASGRGFSLLMHAGGETAEWAYDRADVRPRMAHERPPVLESWPDPGEGFPGHRYYAVLRLPGRYYVDGVRLERLEGAGRFVLARLGVFDAVGGRATPVSLTAAYVSDTAHFREAAATPGVRLFELPGSFGHAHVAATLARLPDDEAVLRQLREDAGALRATAVAVPRDAAGASLPEDPRPGRAEVERAVGGRIDVRAEGPGLLVLAEGWDPGWSARVGDAERPVLRVNHVQMAVPLPAGVHRVALRHRPAGLDLGLTLAAAGAGLLALAALRERGGRG